jgi:2-oxoglutarate ferredoxin oxidoreductase subunit alpha
MDKFMSSSVVTCKRLDPDKITIDRGKLLDKIEGDYRRFALTDDGISPRSKLGLENGVFWNTGDESDEYGHISEDPVERIKMMDKRMSKLELIVKKIPKEDQITSFGVSDFTIISWGSPKGPIIDAMEMLKKENINVGFVQFKLLHPFPSDH